MKSYWIETWGCQMNEHDSEKLAGSLEGLGYTQAAEAPLADIVLLNTCAIREKAEERVYQALAQLQRVKLQRPEMIIGVCGCVAQMSGEGVRQRAPYVDLVLGPRAATRLPEHLARITDARGIVDTTLYQDSLLSAAHPVRRISGRVKAYVTIMEGCNKTCTYCIVPTTRGREDSRALDAVLTEVRHLAAEGYQEIELLGQNVNAWRCPTTHAGLGDLLRAVGRVDGVRRLRFTTSHPLHLSPAIIAALRDVPEVCDFLHLPVQSGSSRVLQLMKRGYDRDKYLAKVAELRHAVPGISLSTDVIVGFPGETEEDFEQTLTLIEQVRFDQMFSFIYSSRPGTVASMLRDDVPPEAKSARLMRLQARQRAISLEQNARFVGTVQEVIIESPSRRDRDEWAGRTTSNRIVNFSAPGRCVGNLALVRILAAGPNSLRGEILTPEVENSSEPDPAATESGQESQASC